MNGKIEGEIGCIKFWFEAENAEDITVLMAWIKEVARDARGANKNEIPG